MDNSKPAALQPYTTTNWPLFQAPKLSISLAQTACVLGVSSCLGAIAHNAIKAVNNKPPTTAYTDIDLVEVLSAMKLMAESASSSGISSQPDGLVMILAILSLVPTAFLTFTILNKILPFKKPVAPKSCASQNAIKKLDMDRRLLLLKVSLEDKVNDQVATQSKKLARQHSVKPSSSTKPVSQIYSERKSALKQPLSPIGTPRGFRPSCLASPVEKSLPLSSMDTNRMLSNSKWKPFTSAFVPQTRGPASEQAVPKAGPKPEAAASKAGSSLSPGELRNEEEVSEITVDQVLERLVDGEVNNFRRLFIPGKGWVASKRLMEEFGITKKDIEAHLAETTVMPGGMPVLKPVAKPKTRTFENEMLQKSPWNVKQMPKASIADTKAKLNAYGTDVPWGLSPEAPFGPAASGQLAQGEAQKQFHPRVMHPGPSLGSPKPMRGTGLRMSVSKYDQEINRNRAVNVGNLQSKHQARYGYSKAPGYGRPTTISVEEVCKGDGAH